MFSSRHLARPNLNLEFKVNNWSGYWMQLLWNLDLSQRKNTLSWIGKTRVSEDLTGYLKLNTKKEVNLALSYQPTDGEQGLP